jgi:hypothetical protein
LFWNPADFILDAERMKPRFWWHAMWREQGDQVGRFFLRFLKKNYKMYKYGLLFHRKKHSIQFEKIGIRRCRTFWANFWWTLGFFLPINFWSPWSRTCNLENDHFQMSLWLLQIIDV